MNLQPTRRQALQALGGTIGAIGTMSFSAEATASAVTGKSVTIGIVADVHQDIIHDGHARLQKFILAMDERKPDYIIQLGDFALPNKENGDFLKTWNSFIGPKYHVLGNHDSDDGFSQEQTMDWWGMDSRYYSFEVRGWHFVVLDGNEANPRPWSGYNRFIGEEQLAWLEADLKASKKPVVIYSHQSMETSKIGLANGAEVRGVIDLHNAAAESNRVVACLCGHHHADVLRTLAGVHYLQINSMSYKWMGASYRRKRFSPEVEKAHPSVSKTAPYRDPLFTVLTLDADAGKLKLEGKETSFIPPTPEEMKFPGAENMATTITARDLNILQGELK